MTDLKKLSLESLDAAAGGQDLSSEQYQQYIGECRSTYEYYRGRGYSAPDSFNRMYDELLGKRYLLRSDGVTEQEMSQVLQNIAGAAVREAELNL